MEKYLLNINFQFELRKRAYSLGDQPSILVENLTGKKISRQRWGEISALCNQEPLKNYIFREEIYALIEGGLLTEKEFKKNIEEKILE